MKALDPATPQRVLMTADTVGGVWTYALDLCRGLSAAGLEVMLATMGAPVQPEQRREAASIKNLTLEESSFRLEWMERPWADVAAAGEWLMKLQKRFRPDLVHLNGYCHAALPWDCPVLVVAHSCVLSWWTAVKGETAPPEWARYRREVFRGLGAADEVVAPTAAMLEAVRKHHGPLNRSRTIYNGRPADDFEPLKKEPFILSAGRFWDEAKNAATLARAASGLPWKVRFAGGSRPDDSPENVEFLGRLEPRHMTRLFGRASIYAHPARYEPFGLAPLEAALSGCALVLGDIPSLREVWGDAAIFVKSNDAEGLHRALQELIASPEKRTAYAAAATVRARRYSAERMTHSYLSAYASLLRARRLPFRPLTRTA